MKIYKHTGNGHYIGSVVIVTAKERQSAEQLIRVYLDSCGLQKEELDIEEIDIEDIKIIHSDNGDY